MQLTLHIWRQAGPDAPGAFETYVVPDVNEHMSFLEMIDVVNERLIVENKEPIAIDSDCREGICGCCGLVINGRSHGRSPHTATCQLHMRLFKPGEEVWIEPFRAKGFPIVKDLIVDRSAFDRILQAGGFITNRTGSAPDANNIPIPKARADAAMDAAACIGCGACVAACPNGSAMLFTAAKLAHLGNLPQGQPERYQRAMRMVRQHDKEGFGSCSNHGACETVCPKGIKIDVIARLNRDLMAAALTGAGMDEAER